MKRLILVAVLVILAGTAFLMTKDNSNLGYTGEEPLDEVTLALDWTPNTNHTGIYVAKQKGWYAEQGIDLKLLPASDTPTSVIVTSGKADVAIGFTEGVVISAGGDSPIVSIASIIHNNTSSIVTRKADNITSLSQLDGKIFGGYGEPFEKPVIETAIKHDGGAGNFKSVVTYTPIEALKSKKVDFVWIYDGWESIEAKRGGFEISQFPIVDHGVPDYSTPDIISSPQTIADKSDVLKRFMNATVRGYEFARQNPDESAKLLIEATDPGTFPDEGLVYESQQYLSTRYQQQGKAWGVADGEFWRQFPEFMVSQNLVVDVSGNPIDSIDFAKLYTNQFVQ